MDYFLTNIPKKTTIYHLVYSRTKKKYDISLNGLLELVATKEFFLCFAKKEPFKTNNNLKCKKKDE